MLAGFLAVTLAVVLLPAADSDRLGLVEPTATWIRQLDADRKGTLANAYSAIVWSAVAVLGLAQLLRPRARRCRRRWLWVLGWLSVATVAALVAAEEIGDWRDPMVANLVDRLPWPDAIPINSRWPVVGASLFGAPLALAGWMIWTEQRGQPVRRALVALAALIMFGAVVHDAHWLRSIPLAFVAFTPFGNPWKQFLEEGGEIFGGAILVVVLIEMVAARPGGVASSRPCRHRTVPALIDLLLVTVALLLVAWHIVEDRRQLRMPPSSYTGPVSLVEQRFRAEMDWLRRIDVWAFVDGAPGEAADIFARLTPEGWDRPIRESRAVVDDRRSSRFKTARTTFHFAPIPNSGGQTYTLAIGVLSGPTAQPYVFLGLSNTDPLPAGTAVINGAPARFADDLAMQTRWTPDAIERWFAQGPGGLRLIAAVSFTIWLKVLAVVVTWRGLANPQLPLRRCVVGPAILTSTRVTASLITMAFLALLAPNWPG